MIFFLHSNAIACFLFLFVNSYSLFAATIYYELIEVMVIENSDTLDFPFVGGLETPQFSSLDLNNDGNEDMLIYDREEDAILPFIVDCESENVCYKYSMAYTSNFPDIDNWLLLKDYNCDGIVDLFGGLGNYQVQVYKGYYNSANEIAFHLEQGVLKYAGNDIEVVYEDIPSICDVDNDGDLDLLINDELGRFIRYYENKSQELGYSCDSLIFEFEDPCWGNFYAEFDDYKLDTCYTGLLNINDGKVEKMLHFQKDILAIDMDGDDDKDLLIGPGNTGQLHYLENGGTSTEAAIVDFELAFPLYDIPVDIEYQTRAYYIDCNNDNVRDLVVAKSQSGPVNNEKVAWYYQNEGSDDIPIFSFYQNDFMINNAIDVGKNAKPIFIDYNGDELIDMFISNYGYFDNATGYHYSSIAYYKNIGDLNNPIYTLVNADFANLSLYQLSELHPALGDLDSDGDQDLIIGDSEGNVYFLRNNEEVFELELDAISIDVGQNSTPQLVDIDNDLDLLIGELSGNVNCYLNFGSLTEFNFVTTIAILGGVNVGLFSVPCFTNWGEENTPHLFVSNGYGNIELYQIDELFGTYTSISSDFLNIAKSTKRLSIASADINTDGNIDFVVGTERGGVGIFSIAPPQNVKLKLVLEGVYDSIENRMSNALYSEEILPLNQPYNTSPWYYEGEESLNTINESIVDWILIALLDKNNKNNIVATKAALLHIDGIVYDEEGNEGVIFDGISSDKYYISIKHRNHIGVISNIPINVEDNGLFDFSLAIDAAYGQNQLKKLEENVYALYAGDINNDNVITNIDFNTAIQQLTSFNYLSSDVNMDGYVSSQDVELILSNTSAIGINEIRY